MNEFTVAEVEAVIGIPFTEWARQCHAISLAIVKSDLLDVPARVARGSCKGIIGQHSWVVVGDDCYADDAKIIDPTLWSYDDTVEGIWYGSALDGRHVPHGGEGTIWQYGSPPDAVGDPIELTEADKLSREARMFLDLCGPLDMNGWAVLAHAPVKGWPSAEIIAAMYDTPKVGVLVPIDIVGMVTDRNPNGLYLKDAA